MKSSFSHVGYQVGRFGPVILFFAAIYLLRSSGMRIKCDVFVVGFIVNVFINTIIKPLIRQRRPNKFKSKTVWSATVDKSPVLVQGAVHPQSYGMPSGHAQLVTYCLVFILMATRSPMVGIMFGVFSIITYIQRVVFKRHYVDQIAAGFVLGALLGYYAYQVSLYVLEHKD